MTETPRRQSAIWAVVLIGLGAVFLLINFGLLPSDAWQIIWRFWPLLLILWGLQIVFGRSRAANWLLALVGLAFVAVLVLYTLAVTPGPAQEQVQRALPPQALEKLSPGAGEVQTKQITVAKNDFANIQSRRLAMNLGTERVYLTDTTSSNYFDLQAKYFKNFGEPLVTSKANGSILLIDFRIASGSFWGSGERTYDVTLGQPSIATDLAIEAGTGGATLDLNELTVGDLTLELGTGSAEMTLSKAALPLGRFELAVGTGKIVLKLPKEVGVRFNHHIGVGSLRFDGQQARGQGVSFSPGYENAPVKLDLTVSIGTGTVLIERF